MIVMIGIIMKILKTANYKKMAQEQVSNVECEQCKQVMPYTGEQKCRQCGGRLMMLQDEPWLQEQQQPQQQLPQQIQFVPGKGLR